jgi:hypothetical protein
MNADRHRRAAYLLGRMHARRELVRERRKIVDWIETELIDLQDRAAEIENDGDDDEHEQQIGSSLG